MALQRPVIVTAATLQPVTVQEVLDQCRLDAPADASYISALIDRATRFAESYQGRRMMSTKLRANWDEFPDVINPPEPPFISLSSLKYTDTAGSTQTLASTASSTKVIIDEDSQPARILPAYGTAWPVTREVPNAVRLEYYAGSTVATNVPLTTRHAILMLVGHFYENREGTGDTPITELPMGVKALLDMDHYGRIYDGA